LNCVLINCLQQLLKKVFVSDKGDIPFRPVVRRVEIINESIKFRNKRFLGKHSLCRIDYKKFNNVGYYGISKD